MRSSPVEARKPSRRPCRYCIRRSRVLTSAVSWARLRLARLAKDRLSCDQTSSSVCHSAWIVGQEDVITPVVGREGLLRLVEWAGRLRARGLGRDGASRAVRERAFSPDDGAEEG